MTNYITRFSLILLATIVAGLGKAEAAPTLTDISAANRVLLIAPSSMPIAGGTATLTIGALHRTGDVYTGSYKIKVYPYFFKNETGRLAIIVSDEAVAGINKGKVLPIIGTATTSGKKGESRHIDATATAVDVNHGTLKLWFMAGNRKMIFTPSYHLSESVGADATRPVAETNLAFNWPHRKQ